MGELIVFGKELINRVECVNKEHRVVVEVANSITNVLKELHKQHEEVEKGLKSLATAIGEEDFKRALRSLDLLLSFTKRHLLHEEEIMRKFNYPKLKEHLKSHDFLRNYVKQTYPVAKEGNLKVLNEIRVVLADWIANHIAKFDKDYGEYFLEVGVLKEINERERPWIDFSATSS